MKKTLIFLIFASLAGGTVFYFGWVQLELPAHTRGVVFTKTRGWDDSPLVPGKFNWRWEKLIPGNFSLYLYPDAVYESEIDLSGELPSAGIYTLLLEGKPSFRYDIRFRVSYRIREDGIVALAREQGVLPDQLEAWRTSIAGRMAEEAFPVLRTHMDARDDLFPAPAEKLKETFTSRFPLLEITAVSPVSMTYPDVLLYEKGRELYFHSVDVRKEAVLQESRTMAVHILQEDQRMETLKKYGELLTRYPVLIEYLAVEKMKEVQPSDVDYLRRIPSGGN